MPQTGAAGDFAETKDVNANVVQFFSATGEDVDQAGFSFGTPVSETGTATIPSTASYVEIGTISGAVTLTLPAANSVTPGRYLVVGDGNGSVSSSATVALKTPSGGGKIGGVANNTASTSAAAYAFLNAAYTAVRLISDGTNWNPA